MRKRCFIIAAIALVVGVFFQWHSYPTEIVIKLRETNNESSANLNKKIRDADRGDRLYGMNYSEYKDPYERDSTDVAISYVSFGLAGVLLIVGFIIGPPKEAANAETQVVDQVE